MKFDEDKFDWFVYVINYPDLEDIENKEQSIEHYKTIGYLENRTDQVPPYFDGVHYASLYNLQTNRDAYIHFMKQGWDLSHDPVSTGYSKTFLSQYNKIVERNMSFVAPISEQRKKTSMAQYSLQKQQQQSPQLNTRLRALQAPPVISRSGFYNNTKTTSNTEEPEHKNQYLLRQTHLHTQHISPPLRMMPPV